ncbi:MAG: hypothetical protein JXA09_10145 [Anaerolineae bacterium]|nr:hypothetical protein [Anaerolineae bacterium]
MSRGTGRSGSAEDAGAISSTQTIEQAILQTVAYADVFDYPLSEPEVHRYLVSVPATLQEVQDVLRTRILPGGRLVAQDGYVMLPGRQGLAAVRRARQEASSRMWHKGVRYGHAIARLPFVRMAAITGTLAVNNIERGADIDYLIVAAPHRVWLTRYMCLFLVYGGRLEQLTICPNYLISSDHLDQFSRSFYTAHELAQMVPVYGLEIYRKIVEANGWARAYLPNAFDVDRDLPVLRLGRLARAAKTSGERLLSGRLGDAWERRESRIKIARLTQEAAACATGAATFEPELCKGHLVDHGQQIRQAYVRRLERIGLDPSGVDVLQARSAS